MHIIITGVHMEMTDAIRDYTLSKMKSLDKYVQKDDTSAKLVIELSKTTKHHQNGDVFQAEARLHTRGREISLQAIENDLYKSIDVLKDMLARELSTHKDKERSIFRKGANKIKNLFKKID